MLDEKVSRRKKSFTITPQKFSLPPPAQDGDFLATHLPVTTFLTLVKTAVDRKRGFAFLLLSELYCLHLLILSYF